MFAVELIVQLLIEPLILRPLSLWRARARRRKYQQGALVVVPGHVSGAGLPQRDTGYLAVEQTNVWMSDDSGGSAGRILVPAGEYTCTQQPQGSVKNWRQQPQMALQDGSMTIFVYARWYDIALLEQAFGCSRRVGA